ncbi:hypothetical protein RRG08_042767 [Elysia crispata]|uniref:Uncharacterized protein n=1 Tax=Elysia crispata TaxID=231223 RepID=A0AAE0XR38_9GAST|nr:hypothetical protein RRG08_042767 [Elysia crispata]
MSDPFYDSLSEAARQSTPKYASLARERGRINPDSSEAASPRPSPQGSKNHCSAPDSGLFSPLRNSPAGSPSRAGAGGKVILATENQAPIAWKISADEDNGQTSRRRSSGHNGK